ncbi:MAG: glycoside hydrolase family 15 protein [Halohasta sp.]
MRGVICQQLYHDLIHIHTSTPRPKGVNLLPRQARRETRRRRPTVGNSRGLVDGRRNPETAGTVSPVGLLAEEVDGPTGSSLGNYPQAFSHIGLLNSALYVSRAKGMAVPGPELIGIELGEGWTVRDAE